MSDISLNDDDDDIGHDEEEDGISVDYSSDNNSEPDIQLENQYYSAKSLKEDSPCEALVEFNKVLDIESTTSTGKGEWGFKALKQIVKIYFRLQQPEPMMAAYEQLLSYTKTAVTRNYSEKSINSILECVSTSRQMDLLRRVYTTTLQSLQDTRNDRLWFKTNAKLGKLYLETEDYQELRRVVRELKASCMTSEGHDDLKKGNQLLEIYALEIQMYTAQRDNKKLKSLYERTLCVKCAIPHPLVMGIIRECGGKMHLREADFERAHTDFFEAFKNYDEAGSSRRIHCLKYLVLASMLMRSGINPFDSQETKPYMRDPEIMAMTNLIMAYQAHDIERFEALVREQRAALTEDAFIREHVEVLLRQVRTEVLLRLVRPYTRVRLDFLARELRVEVAEVDRLLVGCILDGQLAGKIDQAAQVLMMQPVTAAEVAARENQARVAAELRGVLRGLESRFSCV